MNKTMTRRSSKIRRSFIIAAVSLIIIPGASHAQKTDIFAGYKALPWGSTVGYVVANTAGPLAVCDSAEKMQDSSKGRYCLAEENPSRLISRRTYAFDNNRFFCVTIQFSDEGLANFKTVKQGFFTDFGPVKVKRDTTLDVDESDPMLKATVYTESYIWANQSSSIALRKVRVRLGSNAKTAIRKMVRSLPDYQVLAVQAQMTGMPLTELEDAMITRMVKTFENDYLSAEFINNTIAGDVSAEETY